MKLDINIVKALRSPIKPTVELTVLKACRLIKGWPRESTLPAMNQPNWDAFRFDFFDFGIHFRFPREGSWDHGSW